MKNCRLTITLGVVLLLNLTACTPDISLPPAPASGTSDTKRYTTSSGTEVPPEFAAASAEAIPGTSPSTTYEVAQWTCLILQNLDGDKHQTQLLLQTEVGMPADRADAYIDLAPRFICPED